jgi:cellulose synthase operon protein C
VAQSDQPGRFLLLAAFLGRQRSVAAALACCEDALRHKAPPEAVAQIMTGILRQGEAGAEQCRRVENQLKEALAKTPDSIPLLIYLADLFDYQARFVEAEAQYVKALSKDGNNVMVLNNLAWLLAFKKDAGRTEALDMINRAVDLVGPTPELLDTRAVIYLRMAQSDKAIDDLRTSLAQSPAASRYFHLARALAMAEKPKEAQQALEEAKKRGFDVKTLHPLEKSLGQQLLATLAKR